MPDERSKYAPRLILVTKCARRVALLESTGIPFIHAEPPGSEPAEVVPIEKLERTFWAARDAAVHHHAQQVALRKAQRLARHGHWRIEQGAHTIVLAAKTLLFDRRDEPIGAPADRDAARAMLRDLIDHGHRLVTGCAYFQPDSRHQELLADTVEITCDDVTDDALDAYLDSGAWRGVAGGYERVTPGDALALRLSGDPTCVAGLPLTALRATFENWSLVPPDDWVAPDNPPETSYA
ncbi:MAG: hypothetical protein GC159_08875 [Phycisphaera sp.]|nr:hypothetical protein [Phycisphaera sp.]